MDVLRNPWWILAAGIAISLVAISITAIFRWRPPQYERLYYDLADLIARQLKAFQAMITIIERNEPTPAQRADAPLLQEVVDATLIEILHTRPRQRLTRHFNFLLAHFNAAWYIWALQEGRVTDELIGGYLQSTSTPPDVAEHLRNVLEEALVTSAHVPDDPSELVTATGTMRAISS